MSFSDRVSNEDITTKKTEKGYAIFFDDDYYIGEVSKNKEKNILIFVANSSLIMELGVGVETIFIPHSIIHNIDIIEFIHNNIYFSLKIDTCKKNDYPSVGSNYSFLLSLFDVFSIDPKINRRLEVYGYNWNNIFNLENIFPMISGIAKKLVQSKKTPTYPDKNSIFKAFKLCGLDRCKGVFIGPEPGIGSDGLAFSSNANRMPKALEIIFKELGDDLFDGFYVTENYNLDEWAKQGVLLLNRALTSNNANLWRPFTDKIISLLNNHKKNLFFILWGDKAQEVLPLIDQSKHLVIEAPHPMVEAFDTEKSSSFYGHKPFSKINEHLNIFNIPPINWDNRKPL